MNSKKNENYYPFGMLMQERSYSSPAYRYGFNGKEKNGEINGENGNYDFGERIYDCRLGRWLSMDVLWKKTPFNSSYSYTYNNPIVFIDIEGCEVFISGVAAQRLINILEQRTGLQYEMAEGKLKYKTETATIDRVEVIRPLLSTTSSSFVSQKLKTDNDCCY